MGTLDVRAAAALAPAAVLAALDSTPRGLSAADARLRAEREGPNVVRSHRPRPWAVLGRQVANPLLWLLLGAAAVSALVGEGLDAAILAGIVSASVGMGFANEYRAERTAAALHSEIRLMVTTERDGRPTPVEATHLVPGDVVRLGVGAIVPADLRILEATALECDESILTGESEPAAKSAAAVAPGCAVADLASAMFMGTVVHQGSARAVVVAIGRATEFGRIAAGLGEHHPRTQFQEGLARFSGLLARVGLALSGAIFVVNLIIGRPTVDALLFSLAVAVGITPQLLPAVVSTSLATGSRRLAARKVLVKRLVCIEDLGDIDVLFTDKTGTLTEGRITLRAAIPAAGAAAANDAGLVVRLGLICNEAVRVDGHCVGGNALDVALWEAPEWTAQHAAADACPRIAVLPFDHERRLASVLTEHAGERLLVTKGAPEAVLERCRAVPEAARAQLDQLFAAGSRVIALATRPAPGLAALGPGDEHDLTLVGLLSFLDPPKATVTASLARLAELGIAVKVVTGDNATVAETLCREIGLPVGTTLTGAEVDALDDAALIRAVEAATIVARVSPEQKARVLSAQRRAGSAVAFLGDGVNDALALHHADVGISVDSATDVAKDAADVILLEHDLGVLADGVEEGRRIFANTIKYVLMGTSSNFGNMFSVTVAAAFLPFLPMLPYQILLNNLLYDVSQLAIPTDRVDEEQLTRPSHWDIDFIRHFMIRFGPISSLFDFTTFALLLWALDAGPARFRSGWFVESLATQTLIVFAIRTRRVPFLRSRPSRALQWSVLGVVAVGAVIPQSQLGDPLGFAALPVAAFAVLAALLVAYLVCVEVAKERFYRTVRTARPVPLRRERSHRIHRIAAPWSHHRTIPQA